MFIQHQYLQLYRKRSPLIQSDIAFILNLVNKENISRWEQGRRRPTIDTLLVYHLLFDIPIESLFEKQKLEISEPLSRKISFLIQNLKKQASDPKLASRISFLDSLVIKLAPQTI